MPGIVGIAKTYVVTITTTRQPTAAWLDKLREMFGPSVEVVDKDTGLRLDVTRDGS